MEKILENKEIKKNISKERKRMKRTGKKWVKQQSVFLHNVELFLLLFYLSLSLFTSFLVSLLYIFVVVVSLFLIWFLPVNVKHGRYKSDVAIVQHLPSKYPTLSLSNLSKFHSVLSLSLSLSLLEFIFSDLWFDFVVVVGCGGGVYLCVRTGWKWRTGVFIKHPKRELHLSNKLRGNIPGRVHSSDRDGFHRIGRLRPQLGRVESSSCWI